MAKLSKWKVELLLLLITISTRRERIGMADLFTLNRHLVLMSL